MDTNRIEPEDSATSPKFSNDEFEELRAKIAAVLSDKAKPWDGCIQKIETHTSMTRVQLSVGAAVFCAFYLIFGYGAQLLCNLIGVAYPAYMSIHAIESSPKEDDTKWLTYWVTFGIMSIVEHFSGVLVALIPFYWLLKCIFLVWCMLPIERNGSYVIYHRIARPYFLKHRDSADAMINDVTKKAKDAAANLLKSD